MDKHHPFSPSKLHRLSACPGSFKLSQGIQEEDSPAAEEGRLLHERVVSGDLVNGLNDEQFDLVSACRGEVSKAVADGFQIHSEHHMSVIDEGFSILTEGTADVVAVKEGKAILYDWKFGRGEVAEAAGNIQLAAYALGIHQEFGVDEVTAVIFQPRLGVRTEHTFTDFPSILDWIRGIVDCCQADGLELRAGNHCRYCQAAPNCPAVNHQALTCLEEHASQITDPTQMAKILEKAEIAKVLAKRLEEWAKSVQFNALKFAETTMIPGWKVKEGASKRTLDDLDAAYGRVMASGIGISAGEFRGCCSLSLPDLEKLAEAKAVAAGKTKKEGKGELLELLADLIEKKAGAKSLAQE
jgi:hypothetical protein